MGYKFIDDGKKHLHTLDGSPLYGTSTVVGILNKPLTWWAAGMALEPFGWRNPKKHTPEEVSKALEEGYARIADLELDEFGALLNEAYRAHDTKKKDSAVSGTDMHAELEQYVLACIRNGGKPLAGASAFDSVNKFDLWAEANVEKFLFAEGHTFSKTHWVGGIVDTGAKMKNGNTALLDFKSSKEAYYSQMVQIAGYALQIEETGIVDKDGKTILEPFTIDEMIVVPFGSEDLLPKAVQNVKDFKSAFIGALENYKLNKAWEDSAQ